MDDKFYVSVTAIIKRSDGKMLITKRSASKKKWPNKWTVPGGRVERKDFLGTPTTTNSQWYHVLINAVKREVKEETGFEISNVKFLCDLAIPDTIIISFVADLFDEYDKPNLQTEECDAYAWVDIEEAKSYDLIEGIYEELVEASYVE